MTAILPCVTFGQIAEVLDEGEMSTFRFTQFETKFGSSLIGFFLKLILNCLCSLSSWRFHILVDDAGFLLTVGDRIKV